MHTLDKDFAEGIMDRCNPPCLSLYQPTHRQHPENRQDPIRFRNLVKVLEESLLQQFPKDEIRPLLEPFLALADDRNFWNHTPDGLAVLGAKGIFRVYKLQRSVAELAIVADSFHTKPLMRVLQSADRFHVLGVSRDAIKLYEGNRDTLSEVEPAPGIPRTITQPWEKNCQGHSSTSSRMAAPGRGIRPYTPAKVVKSSMWTFRRNASSALLTARSWSTTLSHRACR